MAPTQGNLNLTSSHTPRHHSTPGSAGDKLYRILACPVCHHTISQTGESGLRCSECGEIYPVLQGVPLMLSHDNPWRSIYGDNQPQTTWVDRLRRWLPLPEERLWTRRSIRTLEGALKGVQPDAPDRVVVNLGAGLEKVYRRLFQPYRTLLRLGLPHVGTVDAYADAHSFPCQDASIDLFISSSVIEHLEDPERAVAEMKRIIRPGGRVYAEIPFIGAYHMAPVDYQRYTISGLEALFARHGFELEEIGICSGPFTAAALLFLHLATAIAPKGTKMIVRALFSWLVHPLKYLDLLCENAEWATYHACNFYYLGRKPDGTAR